MKKYDFVAVDFETATNSRMICQIGIAAVVNDEIVDEVDMLVQPPCNHYDNNVKIRHHVREADTLDKPTFDQIWPDINKYFYGQRSFRTHLSIVMLFQDFDVLWSLH